jgi:hypothetical protein
VEQRRLAHAAGAAGAVHTSNEITRERGLERERERNTVKERLGEGDCEGGRTLGGENVRAYVAWWLLTVPKLRFWTLEVPSRGL